MTRSESDFDELFADLPEEEQARLRRIHDLLAEAGPPPELPSSLRQAPRPERRLLALPRRRPGLVALAAALALTAAALAIGYVAADEEDGFARAYSVEMLGAGAAPNASATIEVGRRDAAGNWPLRMRVRGLRPLPRAAFYELFLTRDGRIAQSCGAFRVRSGTTVVDFTVPWRLKGAGWVVTRRDPTGDDLQKPLLTTRA